jgi:hypothetical protein
VARTQRHSESAPQGGRGFFTRFRSVTNVLSPTAPGGVTPDDEPGQEPDLGTFPPN